MANQYLDSNDTIQAMKQIEAIRYIQAKCCNMCQFGQVFSKLQFGLKKELGEVQSEEEETEFKDELIESKVD